MKLFYTERFRRGYESAPPHIQRAFDRRAPFLVRDLRHPSLFLFSLTRSNPSPSFAMTGVITSTRGDCFHRPLRFALGAMRFPLCLPKSTTRLFDQSTRPLPAAVRFVGGDPFGKVVFEPTSPITSPITELAPERGAMFPPIDQSTRLLPAAGCVLFLCPLAPVSAPLPAACCQLIREVNVVKDVPHYAVNE